MQKGSNSCAYLFLVCFMQWNRGPEPLLQVILPYRWQQWWFNMAAPKQNANEEIKPKRKRNRAEKQRWFSLDNRNLLGLLTGLWTRRRWTDSISWWDVDAATCWRSSTSLCSRVLVLMLWCFGRAASMSGHNKQGDNTLDEPFQTDFYHKDSYVGVISISGSEIKWFWIIKTCFSLVVKISTVVFI